MPAGIPVGTLAIGEAGAKNAALLSIQILANEDLTIENKLIKFRAQQTKNIIDNSKIS
jgi:5-(carboxyamino)imidazole ribonucleotide mutase